MFGMMLTLNMAFICRLKEFKAAVDKLINKRHNKENAIFTIVKQYISEPVYQRGKWVLLKNERLR